MLARAIFAAALVCATSTAEDVVCAEGSVDQSCSAAQPRADSGIGLLQVDRSVASSSDIDFDSEEARFFPAPSTPWIHVCQGVSKYPEQYTGVFATLPNICADYKKACKEGRPLMSQSALPPYYHAPKADDFPRLCETWAKETAICKEKPDKKNDGSDYKAVMCGDCDSEYHPINNRAHIGVAQCAEECKKVQGCKVFSYGETNQEGGAGLGCRVSKSAQSCPITTARFCANDYTPTWTTDKSCCGATENGCGPISYWGGQVYELSAPAYNPSDEEQARIIKDLLR